MAGTGRTVASRKKPARIKSAPKQDKITQAKAKAAVKKVAQAKKVAKKMSQKSKKSRKV